MEDQRRSPRSSAHAAIVVDDGHSIHAATVRDASAQGLFVETSVALALGTTVTLSPLEAEGIEVKARVVHARSIERGVGLELVGAPEDNARFLAAVLGAARARAKPRRPTIPPGQSGNS